MDKTTLAVESVDGVHVGEGSRVHVHLGNGEWLEGEVVHVQPGGSTPMLHVSDGLTTRPVYPDQVYVKRPPEAVPVPSLKVLIVGRSASGKDRLAAELARLRLKPLRSCTTRPPRSRDEDTHVFVSDDEADDLVKRAVAYTEVNGARYFAMPGQMEKSDFYIVDPQGVADITEACPDLPFLVVYVSTDEEARKQAAAARKAEFDSAEDIEAREASEALRFEEFEQELESVDPSELNGNILGMWVVRNDYLPETLEEAARRIASDKGVIDGYFSMLRAAEDAGILASETPGIVAMGVEPDPDAPDVEPEPVEVSENALVASFMADPKAFGPIAALLAAHGLLEAKRKGE